MMGSVTLTGTGSGSGEPPEEEPTEEEPPTDDDEENPPSFDFCALLRLIVGIALIATLLSVVASACTILFPAAIPTLVVAVIAAIVGAVLVLLICRPSVCRLVGVLVWAFKWAIVLGALIAIGCGSIVSAFIVVIYGGIVAALIWFLVARGCRVPRMQDAP